MCKKKICMEICYPKLVFFWGGGFISRTFPSQPWWSLSLDLVVGGKFFCWQDRWVLSLRIQICPKKGMSPIILFWDGIWDRQSYSFREGSGFLGCESWNSLGCVIFFDFASPFWEHSKSMKSPWKEWGQLQSQSVVQMYADVCWNSFRNAFIENFHVFFHLGPWFLSEKNGPLERRKKISYQQLICFLGEKLNHT